MYQIPYFAHLGDEHKDPISKWLNDKFCAQIMYKYRCLEKLGHGVGSGKRLIVPYHVLPLWSTTRSTEPSVDVTRMSTLEGKSSPAKGKTTDDARWRANWWDLHPLVEDVRRYVSVFPNTYSYNPDPWQARGLV